MDCSPFLLKEKKKLLFSRQHPTANPTPRHFWKKAA
jgi:hypothetical protein